MLSIVLVGSLLAVSPPALPEDPPATTPAEVVAPAEAEVVAPVEPAAAPAAEPVPDVIVIEAAPAGALPIAEEALAEPVAPVVIGDR
ncbi:MAG TPA: hypothetical protein VM869_25705, partial [Enhygromyxa sp.]|nr:hypothetical protein [Enhygromyxa sp.]